MGVGGSLLSENGSLTRSKARKALEEIEASARIILRHLSKTTVRDALLVASDYDHAAIEFLEPTISKLQSVTKEAEKLFPPGRAGSARAALRISGLTAKELCAFSIAEAWLVARKSYPGKDNQDAHAAAALLWELSGNESPGKSEAPDWGRQFRNVIQWAKDPDNARDITVFRHSFQPQAEVGTAINNLSSLSSPDR